MVPAGASFTASDGRDGKAFTDSSGCGFPPWARRLLLPAQGKETTAKGQGEAYGPTRGQQLIMRPNPPPGPQAGLVGLSPKNAPSQRPVVARKRGTPTLTPTLKPFFYRLAALAGPGVIGGWPPPGPGGID